MSKIVLESVAEATVGFEWSSVYVAPVLMEPNVEMDPGLRILLRCPPHEEAYLKAFDGKRVRVTIEVVVDNPPNDHLLDHERDYMTGKYDKT